MNSDPREYTDENPERTEAYYQGVAAGAAKRAQDDEEEFGERLAAARRADLDLVTGIVQANVERHTSQRDLLAVLAAARDVVEQAQPRDENSAIINAYWLASLRAALRAAGVEVQA